MARSDALARLLPFAAVLCLFVPALRLPRERSRIWFAALAAASPLLLVYAAEARAYGLLALFDFALFFLLFRGKPSARRLAGAAALTALALWTHYLAILFVASCALLLIVRRRFLSLSALCAGVLVFLPWIPVLAVQPPQATSWMREPLGESLLAFVSSLGGAGRIPNPQGGPLPGIVVTIGLSVAVGLLIGVARAGRQDPECADAALLSLLTMALVLAASLLFRPVAFAGRSEIAILPIWLWSVSRAATAGRAARWVTATSAAVAAVAALLLLAAPKPVPSSSRAVSLVGQLAAREDRVIATAAFYLPARLAYDRGTLAAPVTPIPRELASHPGWFAQAPLSREDGQALDEALAASGSRRAFLLLHPFFYTPQMARRLAGQGHAKVLFERTDALVIVWTNGPTPALPKADR